MKKASEISFGVEIECNIPNAHRADFPCGSYHHGISIPVAPSAGWNCQSDSSVHSTGDFMPCEIVSPKLTGESGLVEVVQMLDYLDSIGARVNPSCGLHVHVSVEGLIPAEIQRVVKLFKHFELAFYALNGEQINSRLNSTFCLPASRWNGSRYQSLNLRHVNDGHIEIRVWAGNLKPEVVVAAIYMATSLVSRATDERKVKTSHLVQNHKPTQVMASYIQQFVKGPAMIVEDMDPADIFYTMMVESLDANHEIR